MNEIKIPNKKYTWARGGSSLSMTLLDRIFVDDDWTTSYPNCQLQALPRILSEHCSLIFSMPVADTAPTSKIFRFEHSWIQHEDLYSNKKIWWNETPLGEKVAKGWIRKITRVRRKLKGWSTNLNGEIRRQKNSSGTGY
jgi:hypothetical protein